MRYFKNLNLLKFLVMTLSGFLLLNCNSDDNFQPITKFLSENKVIEIGDFETSIEIEVVSNENWMIETTADWINPVKVDDKVILNFSTNESDVNREAILYLKGNDHQIRDQIKIIQSKLIPSIKINEGIKFISVDHQQQTVQLTVQSNRPWNLTNTIEWISIDTMEGAVGEKTITIEFEENRLQARNGKISFNYGGEENFDFVISQSQANTGFEDTTHNFYITFGTLPTLYAGLQLVSHEVPSYVFYERQNTFDPQNLPSYATVINLGGNDVQYTMRDYMKAKILEINESNPNAVFGLYVDDFRARIGYDWFIAQGIDKSRVKVTLLSDGTGSYNEFYNRYGANGSSETKWVNTLNEIQNLHSRSNSLAKFNPLDTKAIPEFESWDWPWPISTVNNYRYFLQYPEYLQTNDSYVQAQLPLMNTVNMPPYEILKNLTPAQKETFLSMVKLDHTSLNNMLNQSPKKNLVIISTVNSSSLSDLIDETMRRYSDEYDIFLSRHPADYEWVIYQDRYPELNILPYMPFEVFFWYFKDQLDVIGGSPSSTFLTIPVEKVKFMYASGPETMPKPLNLIMASSEANIDWMTR